MARPTGCRGRPAGRARDSGVGVVSVTHGPHPVGDRSRLLGRGRSPGDLAKGEVSAEEPARPVSGRAGLDGPTAGPARPQA